MRSLVCIQPGEFAYREMDPPVLTEGNTILQIKRIGICGTDFHAFEGTQPFFSYPRVLGHELAADILEPGSAQGFQRGETVTIIPYFHCGICIACRSGKPNCCARLKVCGVHIDGAMVNHLSVPSYALVHGDELSHDVLALVEPLAIGAHGVRRAGTMQNEFVLVVGAGPIGLATMEFARIAGAKVIAMDIHAGRLAFCKEKLRIAYTVNPAKDAVMQKLAEITNGDMPTVVMDATGNLRAINQSFQYLAHGGRYVLVGLQKRDISFSHPEFHKREATLMSSRNATREDFEHVINCIKKGIANPTPFITHRASFEQVKDEFYQWTRPENQVIKVMVSM